MAGCGARRSRRSCRRADRLLSAILGIPARTSLPSPPRRQEPPTRADPSAILWLESPSTAQRKRLEQPQCSPEPASSLRPPPARRMGDGKRLFRRALEKILLNEVRAGPLEPSLWGETGKSQSGKCPKPVNKNA